MGRRVKLSDQKKAWFQIRGKRSRRFRTRPQRERFLIVCEGVKTEPNYFNALAARLPRHLVNVMVEGIGANTLSLVEKATKLRDNAAQGDYPY